MADFQIPDKILETTVDRAVDSFLFYDASALGLRRTRVNNMLNITGAPVGDTDVATLTNKTLTAPTISSPVLSGTLTGTYTIGGTPTFPSSVVTLTGSQTLTNKVLTAPTINTATIANPTLTVDSINEFTGAAGVTIDGVLLKDSKMNGSYLTDSTVGNSALALGVPVQIVSTNFTAVATGTTAIPYDDTIPQITEGNEYMTRAITPKSATNILLIIVQGWFSTSIVENLGVALFQDSTANAIAAVHHTIAGNTFSTPLPLTYSMVAGTTSSTTFRVRAGGNLGSTVTFNGQSGARRYGGISKSCITIIEYKA